MTKKLINIKNFLRIVISLMVIFSMARSCAKALSYDDILDYVTNTADYFPNNSKYQIIKQQISTSAFEYQIEQYASSYDSVYLYWVSGGSYQPATVNCYMFTDNDGILTGNGQLYCNGPYCSIIKPVNSSSTYSPSTGTGQQNMDGCFRTTANQENNLPGMCYTNYTIEHMPATFVGSQAMPQFTYYIGNLHTKEITYNGETVLANTLNYNYRISWVANVVCEDTIITSMHAYLDDYELECIDLGTYWNLEYANSTMFKYNQLYNLRVDSIIDGNIETLEAKILFVPPGTVIENNSIASYPSGDYSFNTENATNQIIDNQNQNQENLLNMSGDSALVVLPSYTFSGDQSENFFTFILDSIEEVFLSEEEASLSLPIYGEEIVINSTDFDVLPSSFKIFIGGYHWFWVGLMILKDVRKIFENLKNGDFEKIASDDINANLI